MALHAVDPLRVDNAGAHDAAHFLLQRADDGALGPRVVVVIDARAGARGLLDRRRHAALELVVIVRVKKIVLAVVLVVDHGLDALEALGEGAFIVDAMAFAP